MANILIVDDTPANLGVLSNVLNQEGYKVRPAINGEIALTAARSAVPDLILLDIRMPGKDGYQVCAELKQDALTRDIPVIFISASDDIDDKVKAFQVGGVDYVTKPFQHEEVLARVRAHLMLQEQRRELEAQRSHIEELNGFKDDLLRIVSHDLKNPISIISGYTEILMEELQANDDHMEFLTNISRTATRMLNLVTDLLDVARLENTMALDTQAMPIGEVLSECVKNYEFPAQQKQINLQYAVPPADLRAQLDAARFSQVMNNLISNAIKYTPEQGTVQVWAENENNHVVVRVRDTGLGIPADALPHLFEKFYRVQNEAHLREKGTGLGLAIARSIIEKHGGQMGVDSELGKGSTFWVALPLA